MSVRQSLLADLASVAPMRGFAGVVPGGFDEQSASELRPGLRDLTEPIGLAGLGA